MPYLNRYAFIGNLTKAPELRFRPTVDKQALCLLNVAINRSSRDERGEKRTHTMFINDVEVWGATGEACAHFLTSGSLVLVEGRMDVDQWQDKQTGTKRSRMKVVAENVQFLRIRRSEEEGASDPTAPAAAEPPPGRAERTAQRPSRTKAVA